MALGPITFHLFPLALVIFFNLPLAQSPEPAQVVGCVLNAKVPYIRQLTNEKRPPLLVLNGSPSGPLFFDEEICRQVDVDKVKLSDIRLIKPEAAIHLYGTAAKNGAVVVDWVPNKMPGAGASNVLHPRRRVQVRGAH